jgi:hypothetical protein
MPKLHSPLTPWQKIMRAAHRGTGLRLSPDEVGELSADAAIATVAGNDCDTQGIWPEWIEGTVQTGPGHDE